LSVSAKMILALTLITTLSGGVLATWDGFTKPRIEKHRLEELKAAIADVLPPYEFYDELQQEGMTLYIGKTADNKPVGIAFQAIGSGFQGKISLMVGVQPGFSKLTGVKVLEQVETPGLGTKIVEDPSRKANPFWFSEQFRGIKLDPEIHLVKNRKPTKPSEIQAITGATISSTAVVRIVNETIEKAKTVYQEGHPDSP
jgi:electron transport complex protein RnfG